jgi:methyl-accepting chemotaxis protein
MLSRISVFARLLWITAISLVALAVVAAIGVVSTGTVQSMLARTETEALKPIGQIAQLNELMQDSFRELLLAMQHNPLLPAVKYHNHGVKIHVDAMEKAIDGMDRLLRDYGNSDAGALFKDVVARANAAEAGYVEVLRPAGKLALTDQADDYNQIGIDVTTKILPLFKEAKKQAAELLEKHRQLSAELQRDAVQQHAFSRIAIIGSCIVIFLIVLGGAFLIGRSITGPLGALTGAVTALAGGRVSIEIPGLQRTDEIGEMAAAVQIFKDALIAKTAADAAAAVEADGKFERGRRIEGITRDFESMIGDIVETVSSASTGLEASAATLSATAVRSEKMAGIVAAASEEASSNVQSVASATEEMSSSVNEISRQVQESSRIANDAVDQARKTNDSVAELSQAAGRIGAVVELINTIAGQTNLLALNATIEAARAGEAGRGFAVVASEVKALAEQTAKATGEISQQINGIQAATQGSVAAIKEISMTIGRMSEISSTIASAVEQQGAATQEISRNVQQAALGTQQVSTNIADVQRGATETGSASSQVLSAAQSLSGDSSRLKLEVSKFLQSVRAA